MNKINHLESRPFLVEVEFLRLFVLCHVGSDRRQRQVASLLEIVEFLLPFSENNSQ